MIFKQKDYGETIELLSNGEEIRISDFIEYLQKIQVNHSHIQISLENNYYGIQCTATPYCEETEESYQNRVKLDREKQERKKEAAKKAVITREKNTLAKLRNK